MSVFRSFLFAPGNHPRRVEKALSLDADAVILDLEDACPIAEKKATRAVVVAACQRPRNGLGYVRVNATTTEFGYGDVVAVVQSGVDGIVLPKLESADEIRAVDWVIANLEKERELPAGAIDVIPIIETGKGMANIRAITAAGTRVKRIAFGAGDFTLDMSIEWSRAETELLPYRSECVLASRAAEIEAPLDTVWVDLKDAEGFSELDAAHQGPRLPGQDVHPPRSGARRQRNPDPVGFRRRMVAQGRTSLRRGRERRLRLHSARRQVHRLPDRPSGATRARDDAAHRRPRQIAKEAMETPIMANGPASAPQSTVKPMQGIRVIDVSSFLAGPFCSTQLAEFGAEVIKIELPKVGDALRKFGTITKSGDSLPWLQECRNKKSATLDLRKPEGAEILKRLVAQADVLVENFQPGTMEKWGLGWDALKMQNHKLVMVRISGFGQTGPYSPRPGFGRIGNAFGGLSYLAGYPDRPPVTPGSATIPDYMAGLYGALGVMFALRARDMTGRGQFIDIGLYEPIFRILDELAASYHYNGFVRERMGPGTVNVVPHSHYATKDGKWIAIACTSDKIFTRLAELQGEADLAGEGKWGKVKDREQNRAEVDAWVTRWTQKYSLEELIERCNAFDVPCGPVNSIAEIFADPQYKARENIKFFKDPRVGEIAMPNVVPRLSDTPGSIDSLGPALGEHNDDVYKTLLGMSDREIGTLKDKGVI